MRSKTGRKIVEKKKIEGDREKRRRKVGMTLEHRNKTEMKFPQGNAVICAKGWKKMKQHFNVNVGRYG